MTNQAETQTTEDTNYFASFGKSANENFWIINKLRVPHPYVIGAKLVAWAADHHSGILNEAAILDAEKHNIHCMYRNKNKEYCTLSYTEHKQALCVYCSEKPGHARQELIAFIQKINPKAEADGFVGYVFVHEMEE